MNTTTRCMFAVTQWPHDTQWCVDESGFLSLETFSKQDFPISVTIFQAATALNFSSQKQLPEEHLHKNKALQLLLTFILISLIVQMACKWSRMFTLYICIMYWCSTGFKNRMIQCFHPLITSTGIFIFIWALIKSEALANFVMIHSFSC